MDAMPPVISISVVFLLLGVFVVLARRRNGTAMSLPSWRGRFLSPRGKSLEVLESRPLGPGQSVVALRVRDRVLILATAASGCTLLQSEAAEPWLKASNTNSL